MIYFTSDQHYNHSNIIKYCNRPYSSVDEMNMALISNYNSMVKLDDTVYHLGDFCYFHKIDQVISTFKRLNGKKHIILGNHDKIIAKNKEELLKSKVLETVSDILEVNLNNKQFIMHHYAQRVWNGSHRGTYHLFGHSHGKLPMHGKSVDVGVDSSHITGNIEYRPFSIYEVIEKLKDATFQ